MVIIQKMNTQSFTDIGDDALEAYSLSQSDHLSFTFRLLEASTASSTQLKMNKLLNERGL